MRSGNFTGGPRDKTFIETARRAQIIAAAIDTIAELGYGQASLARIAERAGTSKGVICYHFAGKDELVRELVADVVAKGQAYMRPVVSVETTGTGRLRSWIEANVAFMREHRNEMIAVAEIARNARDAEGNRPFDSSFVQAGVTALARMLAQRQETGEFRADFDPAVMAAAIRAAIDAIPARLARDPGLDLDHYGRELANLFDVATRGGR
jgi:TetR/AcrR family transcriptional regulator, fatty acid metabolism regulator protein